MVIGTLNHAGSLRPATPYYPDGSWGYIEGNGGVLDDEIQPPWGHENTVPVAHIHDASWISCLDRL